MVLRDISERKEAEETLKRAEEKYHNIFEQPSKAFSRSPRRDDS